MLLSFIKVPKKCSDCTWLGYAWPVCCNCLSKRPLYRSHVSICIARSPALLIWSWSLFFCIEFILEYFKRRPFSIYFWRHFCLKSVCCTFQNHNKPSGSSPLCQMTITKYCTAANTHILGKVCEQVVARELQASWMEQTTLFIVLDLFSKFWYHQPWHPSGPHGEGGCRWHHVAVTIMPISTRR